MTDDDTDETPPELIEPDGVIHVSEAMTEVWLTILAMAAKREEERKTEALRAGARE